MRVDADTGEIHDFVPRFRSAYNYDRDTASVAAGLSCPEATRAQQQFKEECDINTLVKRFGLTGELPQNVRAPLPEDFYEVVDLHSALEVVRQARDAFAEMPADVRKRFNHDPVAFMQFANDPANQDEARSLGLAMPAPAPAAPVEVIVKEPPKAA